MFNLNFFFNIQSLIMYLLLFDSKNKYNYNSIAIVTKEGIALAHIIIFNINDSRNKCIISITNFMI